MLALYVLYGFCGFRNSYASLSRSCIPLTLFTPSLLLEHVYSVDLDTSLPHSISPSRLCPYCDEPLPPEPTPKLRSLLAAAKRKSYAEPRPSNSRGLRAPPRVYIAACQRHEFETHQIPMAREKGWPAEIDFEALPGRVHRFKSALSAIVKDEGAARGKCVFWEEMMCEVEKTGSRAVTGVKGQFASFEKTQPG